jgi:hypothetical protein
MTVSAASHSLAAMLVQLRDGTKVGPDGRFESLVEKKHIEIEKS